MMKKLKQQGNYINCKRCGKCCYFEVDGVKHKCRYLIRLKEHTLCRIYKDRLGREIYKGISCSLREHDKRIIEGCPFNLIIKSKSDKKATKTKLNTKN